MCIYIKNIFRCISAIQYTNINCWCIAFDIHNLSYNFSLLIVFTVNNRSYFHSLLDIIVRLSFDYRLIIVFTING